MIQKLRQHIQKYWYWWAVIILSIAYITLQYNRYFNILAWADTDDALQYNLSKSLVEGNWLGPYNRLTLIKGIGFPVWTALLHILHIPLWLGNSLLTIFSCLVAIYAIRRLHLGKWALVLLYGLLLFSPMIVTRAYRDVITPAIALLVCAWAIGMFVTLTTLQSKQLKTVRKDLTIFTLIGVISLPAWYYVREDPLWLMLTVYILVGATIVHYLHRIGWRVRQNIGALCILIVLLVAPYIAVTATGVGIATLNKHYYGRYVINDYFSKDFVNAYATLSRVDSSQPQHLTVPVSYDMRQKLYKASPLFKELEYCLDSGKGVCNGFKQSGPNKALYDYEGGWFPFAVRLAVEQAGHYTSATAAKSYYLQLTDQVNAACNSGALACHPARMVTFMRLPTAAMVNPLSSNVVNAFRYLLTLKYDDSGFSPIGPTSPASDAIAKYYSARYAAQTFGILGKARNHVSIAIYKAYAVLSPVLAGIALVTLVGATIRHIRFHTPDWKIITIAWALLAAIAAKAVLLAYVQTVSFPAITNLYFASTYPLLFLFEGLSLVLAIQYVRANPQLTNAVWFRALKSKFTK